MLGAIYLNNQICFCAKEIHNKKLYGNLSPKLNRVSAQEIIPQMVFLLCCLPAQFLRSLSQFRIMKITHLSFTKPHC